MRSVGMTAPRPLFASPLAARAPPVTESRRSLCCGAAAAAAPTPTALRAPRDTVAPLRNDRDWSAGGGATRRLRAGACRRRKRVLTTRTRSRPPSPPPPPPATLVSRVASAMAAPSPRDARRTAVATADDGSGHHAVFWLTLAGCDVCVPRALVSGTLRTSAAVDEPRGIVHFVGGFITGQFPRAAYGRFITLVAERANVIVVATPFQAPSSLTSSASPSSPSFDFDRSLFFDHASLASTLFVRFRDASAAVARYLKLAERPPEYGVGHSLGAKLLALMASLPETRAMVRVPHAANVLVSYNNFSAARSIPLFEQMRRVGVALADSSDSWRRWGERAGDFLTDVREAFVLDEYDDNSGTAADTSRNAAASSARRRKPHGEAAAAAANRRRSSTTPPSASSWQQWAASAAKRVVDGMNQEREFRPSPAETRDMIESHYNCASNMIVKFDDDSIDESDSLAGALMYRFPQLDGAVHFRQLRGTHLTPVAGELRRRTLDNDPDGDEDTVRGDTGARRSRGENARGASRSPLARDEQRNARRAGGSSSERTRDDDELDVLARTVAAYLVRAPRHKSRRSHEQ